MLSLAAGAYSNPSGATRETIDDYTIAYDGAAARLEASQFVVLALRKQYGRTTIGSVRLLAQRGRC